MIGTVIGGYRVDGQLGEGGMGEVFSATHELMGKRVAIKVLRTEHSQNADVISRFFREARAAVLLNHPGCVDIIDTGRLDDGRGYIIMALCEGENLKDRIGRGRLPQPLAVAIARQIADVLSCAHAKGIIHRDLKPENVFLTPDEGDPSGVRVRVLDFGVAKLSEGGLAMTNPNAIIGTPAYMAPEQCKGARFVDAQSDIYALGTILYEMLCGRTPFTGAGFGDYLMAHLSQPVPPPTTLVPIDRQLERVIMRALAKTKEERQRSMAELINDLDMIGEQPTAPHAVGTAPTLMGDSLSPAAMMDTMRPGQKSPLARPTEAPTGPGAPRSSRRALWFVVAMAAVAAAAATAATILLTR